MTSDLERAQRPSPAQQAALDALAAERRKPDDADRPPPSVLPGPKAKALPGQLTIEEPPCGGN